MITPSTSVTDPDAVATAERTVRYFGLKPRWYGNARKKFGYVGGTIQERLDDLHAAFADGDTKAVFPIRGGYGSGQLLDRIDYDLIRRNPKVFVGYSDITAMHLAISRKCGMVTFHGPTMLSGFTDYTVRHLKKALFEKQPLGVLRNPEESNTLRPDHTVRTIRGGRATGQLMGGNLSLILATMGTPFEIDTRGKIFFIEDVEEQPYSVDRMLTNLRLAGKLQAAAGIVFGECNGCSPRDYRPSFSSGTLLLGEVLDEILGKLSIPVLTGLTIGHTQDQMTLPIGVNATLDADKGELIVEESAFQ
ncbi:MAG: LD-carboxypeptidase [Bryobacteraceae bacterium]|nr:LD-carboxypeptidase [Bryobacteraceae bacterium]